MMEEKNWLTSDNVVRMLQFLRSDGDDGMGRFFASDRQLRLFACACCRDIWHLLTDERSRRAVEVGEMFADAKATTKELDAASAAARAAAWDAASAAARAAAWTAASAAARDAARAAASAAAWTAASAAGWDAAWTAARAAAWTAAWAAARARHAALLRDIFGNPWRRVYTDELPANRARVRRSDGCVIIADMDRLPIGFPRQYGPDEIGEEIPTLSLKSLLAWRGGIIPALAGRMYDSRDFADMGVLADALEEAGCQSEEILMHCRGLEFCADRTGATRPLRGPHVRGCWVVDLLLALDVRRDTPC